MTKQKIPPYVREHLEHLDHDLRAYGGQDRINALEDYQRGLEQSLHESYPKKFAAPTGEAHKGYFLVFMDGIHFGQEIGPDEAESIRETLLVEIEKRKNPKTRLQKLNEILNGLGHFRTTGWMQDFGPKIGG